MPRWFCLLAVMVWLVGCRSAPLPAGAYRDAEYPADFTLTWRVNGPTEADGALDQPAVYLLDADRRLRVSLGPISRDVRHPPTVAELSPAQVAELWQQLRDAGLTQEEVVGNGVPASPGPAQHAVEVTAHRQRSQHAFTLLAHPDAAEPLDTLQRHAGLSP